MAAQFDQAEVGIRAALRDVHGRAARGTAAACDRRMRFDGAGVGAGAGACVPARR